MKHNDTQKSNRTNVKRTNLRFQRPNWARLSGTSQDWLAVILGPAISVPFATCYAALVCSDASLRSHFPMILQHLAAISAC